jgi:hypothetical protein
VTELTCTLVIGGQKLLCQLEMWWPWSICHVPQTCHHLTSSIRMTKRIQNALRVWTEVLKHSFQECFQKLYEHCKK